MQTDREFNAVVELPGMPGPSIVSRSAASADPDHATAQTVERMTAAARRDSETPQVYAATAAALRQAVDQSEQGRCESIYRWIATRVRFRSDEPALRALLGLDNELDFLTYPARLLTMGRPAEDCDGFTMLCCAMLLCAGVPCEVVTIKADPSEPGRFSHVYCQALTDAGAIVMDCSQAAQHGFPLGWEPPEYFDRQTWGVMHPAPKGKRMQGMGDTCDIFGCYSDAATPVPAASSSNPLSSFDWNSIIKSSFNLASQISLKPGQYVQNAQGVMANQVPGAIPGQFPGVGVNIGGISSTTILLGGAALLAVVLLSGRR